jgi:hypothetical protein
MTVKWLLALFGFLVLAVVEMPSLIAHFRTHLVSQGADIFFLTYTLAWVAHALTTDPIHLFDANIAYPLERTLAFSDHLVGVMPFFAPVYLVTGNAVAGYNALLLLSAPLAAFGAFALAWWWTRRWWPSIVAGTLFGWAPLRLSQLGHIQMLTVFWAPWALLFLDRFLRARRWLDLWAFAIFYWLQVLSSFYLGMMLTVAVALYLGYYALAVDRGLLGRALVRPAAAFVIASLVVLLPFHLPYLEVRRAWEASWTPGALAGYSADVQSYLSAQPLVNDLYVSLFRPVTPSGAHERLLFPGLVLPALVLLGLTARVRGVAPAEVRRGRRIFGLVALVALVLSLGPYLVLWGVNTRIPMPYLLLYYVVPAWSGMRVPARFAFLLLLAAVPLSALGAQVVAERVAAFRAGTIWRRLTEPAIGLALVSLFLLELGAKPLPLRAVPSGPDIPEVHRWLARERPGPIVEVPVDFTVRDQMYLYLSTVHWLPLINGHSSFMPSSHEALKVSLAELPGPRALQYVAALGLRALVVHDDELSRDVQSRWAAAEQAGRLRRLAAFGSDIVYGVDAVALAPALRARLAAPDALATGARATLGLRLESDGTRPWVQGVPHRIAHAAARWISLDTGTVRASRVSVMLPLVVGAGESVPVPLRISAPARAGRYALEVELDVPPVTSARHTIELHDGPKLPTSADAGVPLTARYVVEDGAAPRVLDPGTALRLRIVAVNASGAVWLSKAGGKKGNVALEWRWLDAAGRPAAESAGRTGIRYDVYPGQSYELDEWPMSPAEAGRYVLEAGLVAEGISAFATDPPVRIAVEVGRPAAGIR